MSLRSYSQYYVTGGKQVLSASLGLHFYKKNILIFHRFYQRRLGFKVSLWINMLTEFCSFILSKFCQLVQIWSWCILLQSLGNNMTLPQNQNSVDVFHLYNTFTWNDLNNFNLIVWSGYIVDILIKTLLNFNTAKLVWQDNDHAQPKLNHLPTYKTILTRNT